MSEMTSLLVTPDEIKRRTSIDINLDDDKLRSFIRLAQDKVLQNHLGTSLYRKLDLLVRNGEIETEDNSKYKLLLRDYVQSVLVWQTFNEYIPYAMFKVNNAGINKGSQENAESLTLAELRVLQSDTRENAEFYVRRMTDYLCENSSIYPEYIVQDNTSDMYPDRDSGYGGWVL
jgi:hypothetical protein